MGNNRGAFLEMYVLFLRLKTGRCEEIVRYIMSSHYFNLLFLFISNIKNKKLGELKICPNQKRYARFINDYVIFRWHGP